MVLEEQICPTLILEQKTQTARKGRRKKSENLSNVSDDGAKFYDEDAGKYINLEALRKKYRKIAKELLYDGQCMDEIEAAVNETQCRLALHSARARYWNN